MTIMLMHTVLSSPVLDLKYTVIYLQTDIKGVLCSSGEEIQTQN